MNDSGEYVCEFICLEFIYCLGKVIIFDFNMEIYNFG